MPRERLTTQQVATALKVSDGTVRRWLEHGRVRGELVDGRWQVPADELDRLLTMERQARSWRATHTSHTKAATTRSAATSRLVDAANRWRANPTDPQAIADLETAIDVRARLTVKTTPGPTQQ